MTTTAQWPELDELYGYVAGIFTEADDGQFRARVHLPVFALQNGDRQVQAHAVGPTFTGATRKEARQNAEQWVFDYLKGAYGVIFRVRDLETPMFGPSHFTGVATHCEAAG